MKIDEIQCIKELRNGSYQAFTQIYEAYADRLYSFVLKQLKNRSLMFGNSENKGLQIAEAIQLVTVVP